MAVQGMGQIGRHKKPMVYHYAPRPAIKIRRANGVEWVLPDMGLGEGRPDGLAMSGSRKP